MSGPRALALACILLSPTLAGAQIVVEWPTMSIGPGPPPTGCGAAPFVCEGATHVEEPGRFEVFVYPFADVGEMLAECAFGIVWPQDWTMEAAELCAGSIIEGDINNLWRGIRILFSPCIPAETAVLRLLMNAPSVGRMQFYGDTGGGPWEYRGCGAPNLSPYFDSIGYVDAGDICGDSPLGWPCSYCDSHHEPAALFNPSSLRMTVEQGQIGIALVEVVPGEECTSIPECGGWPLPCYDGFGPQVEWLSFTEVGTHLYEAHVDATGLALGVHHGSAEAEGGGCCKSICWPVEVTVVQPSAVGPATWGQIKSTYH
jgi:hypothetical protein